MRHGPKPNVIRNDESSRLISGAAMPVRVIGANRCECRAHRVRARSSGSFLGQQKKPLSENERTL
jgi:hypothetical protein